MMGYGKAHEDVCSDVTVHIMRVINSRNYLMEGSRFDPRILNFNLVRRYGC